MARQGKLGRKAKLYRNTGSYDSPTWSEVTLVRDLTLNLTKAEADASTRGSDGWEEVIGGLKSASVSFGLKYVEDNTDLIAFEEAFHADGTIELAIMSGGITTAGSRGLRATFEVFEFTRNEQQNETMSADVTIKPSGQAENPPENMVVS